MTATETYLKTLLAYFEEEIGGEAYFHGLARHFSDTGAAAKLALLGEVERCAAEAVRPLLDRHGLRPRAESELAAEGEAHVARHAGLTWPAFVAHMLERYPAYLDDFAALEAMAPPEDLPPLKILTEHEVVAIDFARREQAGDPDSAAVLRAYISANGG